MAEATPRMQSGGPAHRLTSSGDAAALVVAAESVYVDCRAVAVTGSALSIPHGALMNAHERAQFQSLLDSFATGEVAAGELPLDEEAFWLYVFSRAAHPGRFHRPPKSSVAAERLLHRALDDAPAGARRAAALASLDSPDRDSRRHAIRFLHGESTDAAPETLQAVMRAAHDADAEVGIEAVRLLLKHLSPQTLPAFLDVLETAFDLRETLASEALVELGAASVPGLAGLLAHQDARVRWRATMCLTRLAEKGYAETLSALLQALHDDSPDVAWVAADGLLALGPDVSVSVLRSVLGARLTPATIRALHLYSERASPRSVFRPLAGATRGTALDPATLAAVDKALQSLEAAAPS
jgi:HEAT repeat protein